MKTMAEVITTHATHGLRDGKHVCHAPGCPWVYGQYGYPSSATVAEHVADVLTAAGFGPVKAAAGTAWDEGFKQGGPMHDVNYDDPGAHRRNPYKA